MIGILSILVSLGVLMFLAYKGWPLVPVSLLAAIIVTVGNGINIWEGVSVNYVAGFKGFAGTYFTLFLFGTLFGKAMGDSGCAKSISFKLIQVVGAKRAILSTIIIGALLSYGGISVFVILFTLIPIAIVLFDTASVPKKLLPGTIALAIGTFTLGALPYSPSILNLVPTQILGTDVSAAPLVGIIAAILLFVLGYWYLIKEEKKELLAHGITEEIIADNLEKLDFNDDTLPHWLIAIIPVCIIFATLIFTKGKMNPLYALSIALVTGSLFVIVTNFKRFEDIKVSLGEGTTNAITALITASSIIGFSTAVKAVSGYGIFVDAILGLEVHPYVSIVLGVNVLAGLVGSATGGITIFLQSMGQHYVDLGINPSIIHRLSAISSGGLDSLPHCSSVVILLSIMGITHKDGYKYIGVTTVLIPIAVTVVSVLLAIVIYPIA